MKSYTDLEQSKILAKILPLESADMHYPDYYFDGNAKNPCNTSYKEAIEDLLHVYINPETKRLLPCWSLAALLGVLPVVNFNTPVLKIKLNHKYYMELCIDSLTHKYIITNDYDNPIDACYEMIVKLHEQHLI